MKFRKLIRILHRDIGYVAFGLTIIYSISGIAVNHVDDWNPNYSITKDTLIIPSEIDVKKPKKELIKNLSEIFQIKDSVKSSFKSSPFTIDVFFNKKTLSANLKTRVAILERVENRPILRESNFLHLNNPKKIWTWVADIFALSLILLAATGLFMVKGKKGIKGRGKWLTLLGIIIPLFFLYLYF
jgi:hypothetical protein